MTYIPRSCAPDGPEDARILVLTDRPGWADLNDGRFLSDHAGKLFWDCMRQGGGLLRSQMRVEALCHDDLQGRGHFQLSQEERARYEETTLQRFRIYTPHLIVALGDWALEFLTGHRSSDKYHLSVLPSLAGFGPLKVLSLLHPERCFREYSSSLYLRLGAMKARREAEEPLLRRSERFMHIRPSFEEIMKRLKPMRDANWLSTDIETSQGHITCIGFGSTPNEALCIPTLVDNWASPSRWFDVWGEIAYVLSGSAKKVLQNGIYDATYLASYGIRIHNFHHDTMVAQRILYPELPVGLDNIARIYTDEPYWKDEGKDHARVKDWDSYYRYNAKDVCVTLAAAFAQRVDLRRKGMEELFEHTMRYASGPVMEASWSGLPLDLPERERLSKDVEARVVALEAQLQEISQQVLQKPTNPRSPVQVKELLRASGFKYLPHKQGKETSDKGALLKLQLKRPESPLLKCLIEVSEVQKELSSYLRCDYDTSRSVIPYTLYAAGTETLRSSCGKDPWNRGLNAQTLPSHLKSMFLAPEDALFVEVDLAQADARVVAWDACEDTLMRFFREKRDIHCYVASQRELFNCSPDAVTHDQRQLGKKVGHAANYGVGAGTLVESCLKEMNLVLSERRAQEMLSGYYRTFPGIPRWHERIRDTLSRTRELRAPTGYVRQFLGRYDSAMHREAYAHLPQHLVSYAINKLILYLYGQPGVQVLLQIHDSGLFQIQASQLDNVLELIKHQDSWNPSFKLTGGDLRIPIEIKAGRSWGSMKKLFEG